MSIKYLKTFGPFTLDLEQQKLIANCRVDVDYNILRKDFSDNEIAESLINVIKYARENNFSISAKPLIILDEVCILCYNDSDSMRFYIYNVTSKIINRLYENGYLTEVDNLKYISDIEKKFKKFNDKLNKELLG